MRDTVLSILLFVTVASAGYHHEEHEKDYFAPAHYKFAYGVSDPHTGDKKSQYETRHGDTVKGGYSLHEPDGTIRVVEYTADKHNGFNAIVKRIGHAIHPYHQPKYNTGYHHGGHGHGGATSYADITHYGADGHHGYY